MKPNGLTRLVSLLVLASTALTAQVARRDNVVPLKNWATPLYWQPNESERQTAATAHPEFQLSPTAVSNTALTFVAVTPCRLVDTRGASAGFNGIAPFSGPAISAMGTLTIPVQSATEASTNTTPAPCGVIPSIAQAYSFNLTVVPHGAFGFLSIWPSGTTQPVVSTLNDLTGQLESNAVIVPAGTPSGGVSVYNSGGAATDVIIDMNGFFAAPTDLNFNTAVGTGTLSSDTSGAQNTASGAYALNSNTTGSYNAAFGAGALQNNTSGIQNTASGAYALASNTTGSQNTASGLGALYDNTTGANNTATGQGAMEFNTTGSSNTADGQGALQGNITGINNTASGQNSMAANTIGNYNTADGVGAMFANTTGSGNTASGDDALVANTTGNNNTAFGNAALADISTGSNNTAVGQGAGRNISGNDSNNIHIGNQGSSGDSGVIKIGTGGTQTSAFIAGISGVSVSSGVDVLVNSSGQLGTVLSSRRFKEQITDMGDSSSKLLQLRPVNFFYKREYDDGSHLLQYGLIAEEVAKVYPEMVAYDSDGQIMTVKYQMLAPMLLNEVRKQNAQLQNQVQLQREENRKLEDRLAALEALLSEQHGTTAGHASSQ